MTWVRNLKSLIQVSIFGNVYDGYFYFVNTFMSEDIFFPDAPLFLIHMTFSTGISRQTRNRWITGGIELSEPDSGREERVVWKREWGKGHAEATVDWSEGRVAVLWGFKWTDGWMMIWWCGRGSCLWKLRSGSLLPRVKLHPRYAASPSFPTGALFIILNQTILSILNINFRFGATTAQKKEERENYTYIF